MTVRAVLLAASTSLLLAAPAVAQTATIADPPEDGALTEVRVVRDAAVTVTLTYAQVPAAPDVDLLVSPGAKDETYPSVTECDREREGFFTVRATGAGDTAVLRLGARGRRFEAAVVREGTSLTYRFQSSVLDGAFSGINPFVCVSGTSADDAFYGGFEGARLKLSRALAKRVVARRVGADAKVRCPQRTLSPSGDGSGAQAFCAFTAPSERRYRQGYANVVLEGGRPSISFFRSRSFPNALRYCGMNAGEGWTQPPNLGAGIEVWGRNVGCRAARRFAMTWAGRDVVGEFRCRYLEREYEFAAVRCRAPGERVIRFETGS